MTRTPILEEVSTRLQRIAMLAREDPGRSFLSLAHHIDVELLREAYRRTRKDGAAGVDGETAAEYGEDLDGRLKDLEGRFKSGRYYAPPVRRTYIPKGDGETKRPIGIPTFEDKVLQRAVAMVLEAVYEEDFLDCSYGFRPGRSAHDALEVLWRGLMEMGGGWVLEMDIKSFFDILEHDRLRELLDRRVRDGVIRRTIDKWLTAGVWEAGRVSHPPTGTPQGGVISPLLANIYLHEVLDEWFAKDVRPRLRGRGFMVRFADDAVLAFSNEADAREVKDVLAKRFSKYGLSLHPEKTRLIEFRPAGTGGTTKGRASRLRLSRLHALLGPRGEEALGGEAQDRRQSHAPDAETSERVVSEASTPPGGVATRAAEQGTAGVGQLLRVCVEPTRPSQPSLRTHACLAQVAVAPHARRADHLGPFQPAPDASPASGSGSAPPRLVSRSEPVMLRNRMREFRTSGSVGGRAGQPPGLPGGASSCRATRNPPGAPRRHDGGFLGTRRAEVPRNDERRASLAGCHDLFLTHQQAVRTASPLRGRLLPAQPGREGRPGRPERGGQDDPLPDDRGRRGSRRG